MLKRFTSIILILAFLAVGAPTYSAAATVIFTVLNDTLVGSPTKESMPVKLGGQPYVPYSLLNELDLKTVYNETLQRLMVLNFNYMLTFDLARDETYDDSGAFYTYRAVRREGTIFVPISLIAQRFEMTYSLINSSLGQIVRVNTEKSYYRDIDILNDNKYGMQSLYDNYQKAIDAGNTTVTPPVEPTTPSVKPDVTIPETDVKKIAYFVFDGRITQSTVDILDSLKKYGYKASFFVSEADVLNNGDLIRRIFAEGHSVGVQCDGDVNSPAVIEDIENTNKALKNVLYTKTRLVWMNGNSKNLTVQQRDFIINAGMRIWDSNIEPKSETSNTYTVRANTLNMLSKTRRSAVVRLKQNEASAQALSGILSFVKKENYTIIPIRVWDGPINKVREMR